MCKFSKRLLTGLTVVGMTAHVLGAERPNILFIFADDQSYETVRAFGHTDIETPNLDRLAMQGTVFTHAYNMGGWNGAICTASRTMINTGRFLWRARALDSKLKDEVRQGRMWSQVMRKAGYETFFTGKWHVNADTGQIFDHVSHVRPGMPGPIYYPEAYSRPIEGQKDPWSPTDPRFEGFWAGGRHWSEVVADDAEHFLDIAAKSDKPFFMYLAFNAPHDPRQAPREFLDRYPMDRIALPENFSEEYPFYEAANISLVRDELLAPMPRTEYAVKAHRREYYAIITHLDAQIGRIIKKLEATGMAGNTVIVYTADHGLSVGHHGFIGKQNMYEHSLRPPLIIAGPGFPQGKSLATRVYMQDLMPTTLELAGITTPNYVEFKSLLPLVRGTQSEHHLYIYGAYEKNSQRALISGNFKMILYPKIMKYRLYNLDTDPMEINDLGEDPAYRGKLAQLKAEFGFLKGRMADPLEWSN